MKRTLLLFLLSGMIMLGNNPAGAQTKVMPGANMAMGTSGMAAPGGISAVYLNPSLAAVNLEDRRFGFSLATFGITGGGPLINIDAHNRHFTKGELVNTENALDDFFGSEDTSMRHGAFSMQVLPIGFSLRYDDKTYFTLSSRINNHSQMGMSRGFMEFMLSGFDEEAFSDGKALNTSAGNLTYTDITLGGTREWHSFEGSGRVKEHTLYGGVAAGYVMGHHYFNMDIDSDLTVVGNDRIIHDFDYTINTTGPATESMVRFSDSLSTSGFRSDFGEFANDPLDNGAVRGHGWNAHIGATWQMELEPLIESSFFGPGTHFLNLSLSAVDLGRISFSEDAEQFRGTETFEWDGAEFDRQYINENFEDNSAYFESIVEDSILTDTYMNYNAEDAGKHSVNLPGSVNFGSYLKMGRLGIAADLGLGFTEQGMNTKSAHYALGMHYNFFGFLPLRTGMRFGGKTSNSFSAGIGVKTGSFDFEISAMTVTNSAARGTHQAIGLGGFNFRF